MNGRTLPTTLLVLVAIVASILSPALGFDAFAASDESLEQNVTTTNVAEGHVYIVADSESIVAYPSGQHVEVPVTPDTFAVLLAEEFAADQFCALLERADRKGYDLQTVTPLPEWEPCDSSETSSAGAENAIQPSDGRNCTAWTETHDLANGDWNLSNNGPMIVHFWSNRTSDQQTYKLYLGGGNFTLPGGGTVYKYPSGCGEQASVEYHETEFPSTTLDHIMSLSGITPGGNGGNNGGSDPGDDCTAEGSVHEPVQGEPWTVENDGPIVVNVYNPFGSDTTTYKVLLEPGSYTFPVGSGGDVSYFPNGCGDAAGAGYDSNSNPTTDWDYLMTLGSGGTGGSEETPDTIDCSQTTSASFNSAPGSWWNFGHEGPMVVNFWSNWTEDQMTYKFLLEPGSYSMPGGGDVTFFPAGCGDAAGAAFDANPNPAGDWGYVQNFGNTSPTAEPVDPTSEPTSSSAPTEEPEPTSEPEPTQVPPTAEPTQVPPTEEPTETPQPTIAPEGTPEG